MTATLPGTLLLALFSVTAPAAITPRLVAVSCPLAFWRTVPAALRRSVAPLPTLMGTFTARFPPIAHRVTSLVPLLLVRLSTAVMVRAPVLAKTTVPLVLSNARFCTLLLPVSAMPPPERTARSATCTDPPADSVTAPPFSRSSVVQVPGAARRRDGAGNRDAARVAAAADLQRARRHLVEVGLAQEQARRRHVVQRDVKRPAVGRVHRELRHELARRRELHQLAGLGGIGVDGVAVGHDQVAVGRQQQPHRPVQVHRVGVDHVPSVTGSSPCPRWG